MYLAKQAGKNRDHLFDVAMHNGTLVGAEALIRWQHPQLPHR